MLKTFMLLAGIGFVPAAFTLFFLGQFEHSAFCVVSALVLIEGAI